MDDKPLNLYRKIHYFPSVFIIWICFLPWIAGFAQAYEESQSDLASWTFMVYMDGDNDLETNGIDDFLWMSSVGSSNDVNILVQFDRIPLLLFDDTRYDNWTGAKRYLVLAGMVPNNANAVQHLGEVNMGNPQTLIDFVEWGMNNYPAENYAVVIWDHGSGWKPKNIQLATDFTSMFDGLTMQELRSAFSTLTNDGAQPIDLIGFDACLMAMIEVDNQIMPYGIMRVGSEETIPREAWPYHEILRSLVADPNMTAPELGEVIVQEYYEHYNNYTLSAVDLGSTYTSLNTAVDDFAQALMDGLNTYRNQISQARLNTQNFLDREYLDLYDFANQVNLRITEAAINTSATAVMNEVDNVMIHEQHGSTSYSNAHGISIYFPASSGDYDSRYDGVSNFLQFTQNNRWDEWLRAFLSLTQWSDFLYMPIIEND